MNRSRYILVLILSISVTGLVFAQADTVGTRGAPILERMVQGKAVPTGDSRYPDLVAAAGTPLVMRIQPGIAAGKRPGVPTDVVVEGPSAFSSEAQRPKPGFLSHTLHKAYIWTKWQLAGAWDDKVRVSGPATHFQYPLLVPDDLVKLLRTQGPDGRPVLLPGDIIMNGIGGIATHLSLYVGPDAKSGEPMIVHALATPGTQQSYLQMVGNAVKSAAGMSKAAMGVVEEPLGGFIARFQRDTYFVMRDPRMTDAMRQKGIAHVRTLVGRGYDYDMNLSDDTLYCTEIGVEMIKAAYAGTNLPLPWVGTTAVHKLGSEAFPVSPDNMVVTPDLVVTHASATGWKALEQVIRTHVVGRRVVE